MLPPWAGPNRGLASRQAYLLVSAGSAEYPAGLRSARVAPILGPVRHLSERHHVTRNRRLTGLLTASFVALLVALPTPALAESTSHADARQDVLRYTSNGYVPAPHNRTADITRFTAAHQRDAVTSTVHVRKLDGQWDMIWFLRTSDKVRYDVGIVHFDGTREFKLMKDRKKVPCPGLSKKIRAGADEVTVSVPRTCLDKPRWVRVGPTAGALGADGSTQYVDNALLVGKINETSVAYGPRLSRG